MTKKEKEIIKKAIRLIHQSNEYYEGMDMLAKLVGWPEMMSQFKDLKLIPIAEVFKEKR